MHGERHCRLLQAWPAMCLHEELAGTVQCDMVHLPNPMDGMDAPVFNLNWPGTDIVK